MTLRFNNNRNDRQDRPRRLARAAALAVLGLTVAFAGVGCNLPNSSGRSDEPVRRGDSRTDSDYPSSESTETSIPRDARIGDSGTGNLTYTAPSDGRIWLRDAESSAVIYSAKIYRGDEIKVEPAANRISVNGRKVLDQDLKKNHKHQLYFDRAEAGGRYGDRHDSDVGRRRDRLDDDAFDRRSDRLDDSTIGRPRDRYDDTITRPRDRDRY